MKTLILIMMLSVSLAKAESAYIDYYILRPVGLDAYTRKLRQMALEQAALFEKFTELEVKINLKLVSIEQKATLILELFPIARKMEPSFLGEIAYSRMRIAYEMNRRLLLDDDRASFARGKTLFQYVKGDKYPFNLANFYALRLKAAEHLCELVKSSGYYSIPPGEFDEKAIAKIEDVGLRDATIALYREAIRSNEIMRNSRWR